MPEYGLSRVPEFTPSFSAFIGGEDGLPEYPDAFPGV